MKQVKNKENLGYIHFLYYYYENWTDCLDEKKQAIHTEFW
jgi:hypothetical protein